MGIDSCVQIHKMNYRSIINTPGTTPIPPMIPPKAMFPKYQYLRRGSSFEWTSIHSQSASAILLPVAKFTGNLQIVCTCATVENGRLDGIEEGGHVGQMAAGMAGRVEDSAGTVANRVQRSGFTMATGQASAAGVEAV